MQGGLSLPTKDKMMIWKIKCMEMLGSTAPFPLGKEKEDEAFQSITFDKIF